MISTRDLKGERPLLALLTGVLAAALSTGCGSSGAKPADGGDGGTHDGGGDAAHDGGGDGATPDGGGGEVAACVTGGTGKLTLTVAGLPAGVTPMVRLTGGDLAGPMVLTIGTPVTVDAGGGYSIEWRRVKTAPTAVGIVGKAFYASAVTFDGCVRSGDNPVTLTYTQEPGSEMLWMTVSNTPTLGHVIGGFKSADIAVSGMKNPAVWKSKNILGRGGGGAFDSLGNFWVPAGDRINMYGMMTLATPGEGPPEVILTQPATAAAKFAAFDSDGNLWVTRGAPASDDSVVRYTPDDMAASGSPMPSVVLKSPDLTNPAGLAFDIAGALWVTNDALGADAKVVKFAATHLSASYTGPADVVLTAKSGPPVVSGYITPGPLAFDMGGNLWVGFDVNIVKFTVAQQATSAEISTPFVQKVSVSALPTSLLFDESGGLWVVGSTGKFMRVPAAALGTAGDVMPDIVIDSSEVGSVEQMVFDPAPTWSPIHDWM
jgi:hypothetical protein